MKEEKENPSNEHGRDEVKVTFDGKTVLIHRGHHSLEDLKQILHVSAADGLGVVENGNLIPIDEKGLTIKGGEVLRTRVGGGTSS